MLKSSKSLSYIVVGLCFVSRNIHSIMIIRHEKVSRDITFVLFVNYFSAKKEEEEQGKTSENERESEREKCN